MRVLPLTVAIAAAALAACAPDRYPAGPYGYSFDETLPELTFTTTDDEGAPTSVQSADYYLPGAAAATLLVVRVGAAWCGTCRWHLSHTHELFALDLGARLSLLDLTIADADNLPATLASLPAYRALIDQPHQVAIDPDFQLSPAVTVAAPLPLFLVVDRRTMKIHDVLDDPDPDWLDNRLHQTLAALDGTTFSPRPSTDGRDLIHRNHWDLLSAMTVPGAPPPDPSNQYADDPAAAALGATLFRDSTLSPGGLVACATCHDPARHFVDGLPQSTGVARGDRNTPSALFAAHARWQFWDGRADSLWAQALGPIENAAEMASSRLFVAHAIFDRHRAAYEATFGALPALDEAGRFPAQGKPGDPAWQAMTAADRAAATRVFVNVGKAIAAYERTLRAAPNALDRYIAGDGTALTETQKTSLHTFLTARCTQCHWGPRLTDDAFHVLRFVNSPAAAPDPGRDGAREPLASSEFRRQGSYSDDAAATSGPPPDELPAAPRLVGAFKTPPLRGVASTAPYGHSGELPTLLDVAKAYGTGGQPKSDLSVVGTREPWLPRFLGGHALDLVDVLSLLTAEPVENL